MARATIDLGRCEELAARAANGDGRACRALVEHLWPAWLDFVRSNRSMGALARSEDHVHEVATRLVEKVGKPDGRGLRLYGPWRERNQDKTFWDWMRIVAKNVVRDYVREQNGAPSAADGEISVKRLLNEFASSPALDELGHRPPLTAAQTARELLEFARGKLPSEQLRALSSWLEGATFEEIALELGSDAAHARKLLRASIATLRRAFGQ